MGTSGSLKTPAPYSSPMADGGPTAQPADAHWRVPPTEAIRQALDQVPRKLLVPGVCEPLAPLDAPVGCLSPVEQAPPCPSPSAAGLVLAAADLSPGDRILVQGRAVGWLALAAAALVDDAIVHVEEEHENLRARWRSARPFRMSDDVRLDDGPEAGPSGFDRVIAWNPGRGASRRLPDRVDGDGSVLFASADPDEPTLARIVVQGDAETTLTLTELQPPADDENLEIGRAHV